MFIDLRLGPLHEPLTGRAWSSGDALQSVNSRAAHLHQLGVKRGDRVFLHYGNTADFFFDVVALWSIGASVAPLDPRFTAYEVEVLARAVAPSFSIWSSAPDESFAAPLQSLGVQLVDSVGRDAGRDGFAWRNGLPRLDDDALLLFTSGTTGEPKAVVHTHRSLRARWSSQRERLGVEAYERTLCMLPTHFAWGLIGNYLYPWLSGQMLFIVPALRTDVMLQMAKLCDEYSITSLATVPATWRLVLKTVAPPKKRTLRRVSCGTAPLPSALARDIGEWSGAPEVLNVYGITETGWIAGVSSLHLAPEEGLVGEPWGSVIRILDSAGSPAENPLLALPLATDETGSIWVQTPSLMKGYFMRDDLTQRVVSGGWFCTGDVGALDDRGLLYLRGRDKEMINVGGVKVYPSDIDSVVASCAGVQDVCAFAFDDPLHGENVGVAVVLSARSAETVNELVSWTVTRLARHQLPRRWYLVDEIARSPRGKLVRANVARACEALTPLDQRTLEHGVRTAVPEVRRSAGA